MTRRDREVVIRAETAGDQSAIRALHLTVFQATLEADLVDALRSAADPFLSFVAALDNVIVGHILFTPATIEAKDGAAHSAIALAPMAVRPDKHGSGIGTEMIEKGLAACRQAGYRVAIVLGHRDYYPRFGFEKASVHGIRSEYEVPDEIFMVMALEDGALDGCQGVARYHPVFNDF